MVRTKFVPIVPENKPNEKQERKSPRKSPRKLDENYVYSDHHHQEEEGSEPSPEMSDGSTSSPQAQKERKISETKSDDVIMEEDNNLIPSPKKETTKGVAKKSTGGYPKQSKVDLAVPVINFKRDANDDDLENTEHGETAEDKSVPEVVQLKDEDDQTSIASKVSSAQSFTTRSGRTVKKMVYKDGRNDDKDSDKGDSGTKKRKLLKSNLKKPRGERSSSSDRPYKSSVTAKDVKRRVLARRVSVKNGYKETNSDESESNSSEDSEENSDSDGRRRKKKKVQKETRVAPKRSKRNIKKKVFNVGSGSDSSSDDDEDYKKRKSKTSSSSAPSRVPAKPEKQQTEKDDPKVKEDVSVRLNRTLPDVPLMKISTASSPVKFKHPSSGSKSDEQKPHIKTIYEDEEYIDLKKLQLTKQIELTDHEIYLKKLEAFKRENELGIETSVYTSELKDQCL